MRLATWNINSLRLRMPLLQRLVEEEAPDIVCLQETKVHDDLFPLDAVKALGFEHVVFSGIKGYNGVAILSKLPLTNAGGHQWVGRTDGRHIFATLPNGTEVHSLYIPAGGDEPDPQINEKFDHKLKFVTELKEWFPANRDPARPIVLVGDLNIAPYEADVWSHKQLLKVVSHTPVETAGLIAALDSFGWVDTIRNRIPEPEKIYTWWSYRGRDWRASDRGRRLDHVWATPSIASAIGAPKILKDARDWPQPSDHVPVLVTIDG